MTHITLGQAIEPPKADDTLSEAINNPWVLGTIMVLAVSTFISTARLWSVTNRLESMVECHREDK